MRTFAHTLGILIFATATAAAAQPGGSRGPGPMAGGLGRAGGNPIAAPADFLLAHTGDLALTDAQVVRLAAISRRTEARRKAIAARMDSARTAARPAPGDTTAPPNRGRGPGGPPPADLEQMRTQMHNDLRDAIAVLTADQQATAWAMVAGGPALGGAPRGAIGGPGRGRGPANPQPQAERGPISRPPPARDVPRRPESAEPTQP